MDFLHSDLRHPDAETGFAEREFDLWDTDSAPRARRRGILHRIGMLERVGLLLHALREDGELLE